MKTTLLLSLALAGVPAAQAQLFRPEAVNGAVLGGVAGAVIGNNSGDLHHNAWKGAAIGAGAGLIFGEAIGNANAANRDVRVAGPGGDYGYRSGPDVRVGVGVNYGHSYGHPVRRGYDYGHRPAYVGSRYYGNFGYGYGARYYGPSYGYTYVPSYGYYEGYGAGYPYYDSYGYYGTGSAAGNGLLLGALAGGIIGHNSGEFRHNGWRGAAWGAGAGLLLGSIVDANRRATVYPAQIVNPPVQPATTAPAVPQQTTIINNYYNTPTPMTSANGLFGR